MRVTAVFPLRARPCAATASQLYRADSRAEKSSAPSRLVQVRTEKRIKLLCDFCGRGGVLWRSQCAAKAYKSSQLDCLVHTGIFLRELSVYYTVGSAVALLRKALPTNCHEHLPQQHTMALHAAGHAGQAHAVLLYLQTAGL